MTQFLILQYLVAECESLRLSGKLRRHEFNLAAGIGLYLYLLRRYLPRLDDLTEVLLLLFLEDEALLQVLD